MHKIIMKTFCLPHIAGKNQSAHGSLASNASKTYYASQPTSLAGTAMNASYSVYSLMASEHKSVLRASDANGPPLWDVKVSKGICR